MAEERRNGGDKKPATSLAKFLRILRIQNDEVLGDMADHLGIMPSYLSSIEKNRRPLTPALQQKLIQYYNLNENQQKHLENCVAEAAKSVEVNLEKVKDEELFPEYVDTAVMFARDISNLGGTELKEIRDLLQSFNTEGNAYEKGDFYKSKSSDTKRI